MKPDFRGRVALVTEGTRGIGLASALAFGRHGAETILSYSSGEVNKDDIRRRFADAGAHQPLIVEADVSQPTDTAVLMEHIERQHPSVHFLVSIPPRGTPVKDVGDLTDRSLRDIVRCGPAPLVDCLVQIRRRFGAYPPYAVAISPTSPDRYGINDDLVATAGAAVETLCRYLAHRFQNDGIRLNVVRTVGALMDSSDDMFDSGATAFLAEHIGKEGFVGADEVAGTVVALCSGLLDGVHGQVITVDRGAAFADTVARQYIERTLV